MKVVQYTVPDVGLCDLGKSLACVVHNIQTAVFSWAEIVSTSPTMAVVQVMVTHCNRPEEISYAESYFEKRFKNITKKILKCEDKKPT